MSIQAPEQRQTPETQKEFNILSGIYRAVGDLREHSHLQPETRNYIWDDEYTHALEAATKRFETRLEKKFDPNRGKCVVYKKAVVDIVEDGVKDLETKRQTDSFEYRRRQAELEEAKKVDQLMAEGEEFSMLVISPFPEDIDTEEAEKYGYEPGQAILRLHHGKDNQVETTTVAIQNSDVELFVKLLEELDVNTPGLSSLDVLSSFYVYDAQKHPEGIWGFIRMYDELLKMQDPENANYFRGERSKSENDFFSWSDLKAKSKDYIDYLMEVNLNLAEQIEAGLITATQAAEIKADRLKKTWSLLSIIFNEEQTKKIFGERNFNDLRTASLAPYSVPREIIESTFLHQVMDQVQPVFSACGSKLTYSKSGLNITSLEDAKSTLFGSTKETWEYKSGICRVCERKAKVGPCSICKVCEKEF